MRSKDEFDFDLEYSKAQRKQISESNMSYFSANSSPVSDRFNFGFTYNILPFNHTLEQRGNDNEHIKLHSDDDQYYVGDMVSGYAPKDKRTHTGRITNFIYADDGVNIRYVWIIDDDTREKFALKYSTLQFINKSNNDNYRRFDYNSIINSNKVSESAQYFATQSGEKSYTLSSGIVVDDSLYIDKMLDDEMYRQWIIDKLILKDNTIKYFDEKFYTDKYQDNGFTVYYFSRYELAECIGTERLNRDSTVNKTEYLKKLIKILYKTYALSINDDSLYNSDIEISSRDDTLTVTCRTFSYNNPRLIVCSYKQLYMFIKALQKIYRINYYNGENYDIIDGYGGNYGKWVNRDCENRGWYRLVKHVISSCVIPCYEYTKYKDEEGKVHYQVCSDDVPRRYEEI